MAFILKDTIIETLQAIILENKFSQQKLNIYLENPKEKKFGDWSVNLAMKIAKERRQSPLKLAEQIAKLLEQKLEDLGLKEWVDRIEVKPPGFINLFLANKALHQVLNAIQNEKQKFGQSQIGQGKKVLLEFVSANPTGPLSVAHARQAAVGDTLANILEFCGFSASREYYINDEGNQIKMLALSLRARYLECFQVKFVEFPQDGYRGEYLYDIAKRLIEKEGNKYLQMPLEQSLPFFSAYVTQEILQIIKDELNEFGVRFDFWSSQKSLNESGEIEKALSLLRQKGYIYEKDGAVWFKSTDFGDDKDRVLIKSDGQYTYLAPDIAYHNLKFQRGFHWLIDIWGPDHHGYINRLKSAVCALGYKQEDLSIIIIQLATLFRDQKPVMMSTRAGEYISLKEVMDEAGRDASRFFYLMRRCDSHLDFDLELAKKKSSENPVYYIQYAHARIASIMQFKNKGIENLKGTDIDFSLLQEEESLNLMRTLNRFPDVIGDCAINLEPQGLTTYLTELAGQFHFFYNKYRVISDDSRISLARLTLADCVRQVIAIGLTLLGVSAPDKM